MSPNTNLVLTITGGVPPLSEILASGNGSYDSATDTYSAPGSNTNAVVEVTDAFGNVVSSSIAVTDALIISPLTQRIGLGQTKTFTATGGQVPYTFSIASGSGSIDPSTGVYTAPTSTGSTVVRVTDNLGATSDAAVENIRPVQLAGGTGFTCARYNEGSVKCWGLGTNGRLGTGATTTVGNAANQMGVNASFVNLGTNRTATKLAVGGTHACAILDNGKVKCWGTNTSGQLGYGDTVARGGAGTSIGDALPAVSLDTAGERTAIDITAGSSHTCVLLDNNTVKCWGLNSSGQLGLGNTQT
jgi:hypothetical protein